MKEFKTGDRVSWKSHGGEGVGTVEKKITSDTKAAGRQVRASQDEPQYLVRSEKGGGEGAPSPKRSRNYQRGRQRSKSR